MGPVRAPAPTAHCPLPTARRPGDFIVDHGPALRCGALGGTPRLLAGRHRRRDCRTGRRGAPGAGRRRSGPGAPVPGYRRLLPAQCRTVDGDHYRSLRFLLFHPAVPDREPQRDRDLQPGQRQPEQRRPARRDRRELAAGGSAGRRLVRSPPGGLSGRLFAGVLADHRENRLGIRMVQSRYSLEDFSPGRRAPPLRVCGPAAAPAGGRTCPRDLCHPSRATHSRRSRSRRTRPGTRLRIPCRS